ncbi:hypothetical protein ISP15_05245 [Dyella jejuensis]|uniref:Uncharacterized protein n=1 Tax=Dyella jejuensis TaxID=1432009 RepID=A0ABW8JIW2_9GAMM
MQRMRGTSAKRTMALFLEGRLAGNASSRRDVMPAKAGIHLHVPRASNVDARLGGHGAKRLGVARKNSGMAKDAH